MGRLEFLGVMHGKNEERAKKRKSSTVRRRRGSDQTLPNTPPQHHSWLTFALCHSPLWHLSLLFSHHHHHTSPPLPPDPYWCIFYISHPFGLYYPFPLLLQVGGTMQSGTGWRLPGPQEATHPWQSGTVTGSVFGVCAVLYWHCAVWNCTASVQLSRGHTPAAVWNCRGVTPHTRLTDDSACNNASRVASAQRARQTFYFIGKDTTYYLQLFTSTGSNAA
jgi:hypothetical protein